jgi:GT2 family glycosyltransferase
MSTRDNPATTQPDGASAGQSDMPTRKKLTLFTFLHSAFPVGQNHLFMDGWIGAWNPTIATVVVDFPSGPVTSDSFECVYFERPDLERLKAKAEPGIQFKGYRIAIELPELRERPQRVVLILQDGKKLAQSLSERYTSAMTADGKLSYLQTSPYPVRKGMLENRKYVASVLRLCATELGREGRALDVITHAEQICFGGGRKVLVSGWMTDDGLFAGPVTLLDDNTNERFPASMFRFTRDDLRKLRNGAVGFGLFLEARGQYLPPRLILEGAGETKIVINTEAPAVFRQSALSYGLAILRNYLATNVTSGFDPNDENQKLALEFVDSLKSRPSAASFEYSWGTRPTAPDVSLIIPVYGSYHLVRSQLLDLSLDVYVQNQEIVYVLDSTEDEHWFVNYMDRLWELYRVPCRLLVMENRSGFSGACNAGADAARASRLLFLNPDVFLDRPESLRIMVETLDADETVGCVGARLLFPDGSVQHVGMTWKRNPSLGGLRLNEHFFKGIDSACVPMSGVVEVPTVTAACLLCRKEDFETVGRFDDGYLWGDFEDSDLCLRMRQLGKRIVCDNNATFIHAEGSSYPSEERQASIAFNALRHEQRWHREIDALLAATEIPSAATTHR